MSWSKILIAIVIEIFFIIGTFYSDAMCKVPFANLKLWSPLAMLFLGLAIIGVVPIIFFIYKHYTQ